MNNKYGSQAIPYCTQWFFDILVSIFYFFLILYIVRYSNWRHLFEISEIWHFHYLFRSWPELRIHLQHPPQHSHKLNIKNIPILVWPECA